MLSFCLLKLFVGQIYVGAYSKSVRVGTSIDIKGVEVSRYYGYSLVDHGNIYLLSEGIGLSKRYSVLMTKTFHITIHTLLCDRSS